MRKVELTMNEQFKYEVIKSFCEGRVSKQFCEVKLNVSRRTVDRLIRLYRLQGKAAFIHGNRGRLPVSKKPLHLHDDLLLLYQNKYPNTNFSQFTELLAEHESIFVSQSFVRHVMKLHHILPPKPWKRTKRAEKLRLKALASDRSLPAKVRDAAQTQLVDFIDAHPRRARAAYFGELLQMDASLHLWFGDKKCTLHAAIDDATGIITGLYMDRQETLEGYYHVLYQTLISYGIPYAFFTDRRTIFEYKKVSSPAIEKDTFTQFAYACSILGTEIRTSSVAQAKGRVERLFQTLQSRLPVEFRLKGIHTLEEANAFLSHYKEKFNQQFSLPIHDNKNAFSQQPSLDKINQILAVLSPRVIDAGHCVKFKNDYYLPLNENGMKQFFTKGTKAMVIEAFDKTKYLTVGDRVYILEKVEQRAVTSPVLDGSEKPILRRQHIPSMSHPWRSSSFESYMNKAKRTQELQACREV